MRICTVFTAMAVIFPGVCKMLFFKECRKVIFSLIFVIYCVVLFCFYFTQFVNDCSRPLEKPVEGQADYGTISKEIPEIMMPSAIKGLISEYLSGEFSAYPYGFYKCVKLKEKDKSALAEIITKLSGISAEELDNFTGYEPSGYTMQADGSLVYQEGNIPEIKIPQTLTYENFRELMREADKIIGGGSKYSDDNIVGNFSNIPKTYEEALLEYEQFIKEDKITGAYARLYCDYLGIILATLPVFVAVFLAESDKKSHMEQLVYTRKISSAKLIFARYFSLIFTMMIPVFITALLAYSKVKSIYPDTELNKFAFLKSAIYWLTPNIMASSALGMLLTEMTSGIIAIFVQGAGWFASIFASSGELTGSIKKFTFVMRHNSLLKRDIFQNEMQTIVFNRMFFAIFSIFIVAFTAIIYEMKRRGIFGGKFIKNRSRKSKT